MGSYPYFRKGKLGVNLVLRATDAARMEAAADELAATILRLEGNSIRGRI